MVLTQGGGFEHTHMLNPVMCPCCVVGRTVLPKRLPTEIRLPWTKYMLSVGTTDAHAFKDSSRATLNSISDTKRLQEICYYCAAVYSLFLLHTAVHNLFGGRHHLRAQSKLEGNTSRHRGYSITPDEHYADLRKQQNPGGYSTLFIYPCTKQLLGTSGVLIVHRSRS